MVNPREKRGKCSTKTRHRGERREVELGRGEGMPSDFARFNRFTPIVLGVPRFQITVNRPPTRVHTRVRMTDRFGILLLLERIDAIARIILDVPPACDLRAFRSRIRYIVLRQWTRGYVTMRIYTLPYVPGTGNCMASYAHVYVHLHCFTI